MTVHQGTVQSRQAVQSTIAPNLVTAGAWRVQVRVQPGEGNAGLVSFWLRAHYLETFAETRYLDTQSTTASLGHRATPRASDAWSASASHVSDTCP